MSKSNSLSCGCLSFFLLFLLNISLGPLAAYYCVDVWFHQHLSIVASMFLGLVGGEFTIPAALFTVALVLVGVVH